MANSPPAAFTKAQPAATSQIIEPRLPIRLRPPRRHISQRARGRSDHSDFAPGFQPRFEQRHGLQARARRHPGLQNAAGGIVDGRNADRRAIEPGPFAHGAGEAFVQRKAVDDAEHWRAGVQKRDRNRAMGIVAEVIDAAIEGIDGPDIAIAPGAGAHPARLLRNDRIRRFLLQRRQDQGFGALSASILTSRPSSAAITLHSARCAFNAAPRSSRRVWRSPASPRVHPPAALSATLRLGEGRFPLAYARARYEPPKLDDKSAPGAHRIGLNRRPNRADGNPLKPSTFA